MKKLMITFMVALFATVVLGQTKTEIKTGNSAAGLGKTKTEIKPNQLPKCILDYVKDMGQGIYVSKAFKIDNKGEITYEVYVHNYPEQRNFVHYDLIFDNNCKLLTIDGKAPSKTSNANTAVKKPAEEKH